jgi:GDP-4-dehydro-6-deoxy-D-mannose reductase
MRSLITGCAGFAGSHLADLLLEQGEEVVALLGPNESRANIRHIEKRLEIVSGDLRDGAGILDLLRASKPQRIYHLAAFSAPARSFENPLETYQVNFTGTLHLLSAWLRVGMDCRFLFVSSVEVYGSVPRSQLPLREEAEMRPLNPYAGSKAAAEILAAQFFRSYGLPIVRVRPFNHTGPRQSPEFVCSKLARQAAEIELGRRPPVIVAGNTQAVRDFSDVRDIVRGYRDLLERGEAGEVYHLCSGRGVSIAAVLETLLGLSARTAAIQVDPSLVRSNEAAEVWGDYSRAKGAVGWEPCFPLSATLAELKQYWETRLEAPGE